MLEVSKAEPSHGRILIVEDDKPLRDVLALILMDLGADKDQITTEIFANKRFAAVTLVGEAMAAAHLEESGRYCWSVVDDAMLTRHHADGEDTEEIVQHLRSVEGTKVAVLIRELTGPENRGKRKVSLRATGDDVDVSAIARAQDAAPSR